MIGVYLSLIEKTKSGSLIMKFGQLTTKYSATIHREKKRWSNPNSSKYSPNGGRTSGLMESGTEPLRLGGTHTHRWKWFLSNFPHNIQPDIMKCQLKSNMYTHMQTHTQTHGHGHNGHSDGICTRYECSLYTDYNLKTHYRLNPSRFCKAFSCNLGRWLGSV